MIEFLQNLSARSFGTTEGIKLVRPRLPSLFESSTDIWDVPVKATPWSPVTEEIPSRNAPPFVSRMNEEPAEAVEIQKNHLNPDRQPVDYSIHHSHPEHPADSIPKVDDTLSHNGKNKLTDLAGQEHTSKIKEEPVEAVEIQKNHLNPDRQPVDYSIHHSHPEHPADSIPQIDETLSHNSRNKSHVSYRDVREVPAKSRSNRLDGHHLVIEDVMITKYVERTSRRDIAEREEHGRRSKIISSAVVQSIPYTIETERLPGPDTWRYEAESKETPTINVTIGRIEVRAVTQVVQNRPKPKGQAPMSLDEYLRGRKGGGQ
jgi:hypothetical protein